MDREAVAALLDSAERWDEFCDESDSRRLDLSAAQLGGADLRHRNFSGCKLDGITFEDALLNGAIFEGVGVKYASFSGAICDETRWSGVVLEDCGFEGASFSGAYLEGRFLSCEFAKSHWADSVIERAVLDACTGRDVVMKDVRLTDATVHGGVWALRAERLVWTGGSAVEVSFGNAEVKSSRLDGVEFSQGDVAKARVEATRFTRCNWVGPIAGIPRFKECRVADCLIDGIGLAGSGILTSVFDDTVLSNCRWPAQAGQVAVLGEYHPAPELLSSPVQEIRGLDPVFRREIADAQYLAERKSAARGRRAAWFRVWGATTGYGQSFGRLLCALAALMLLLVCAVVAFLGLESGRMISPALIGQAALGVFGAMIGRGASDLPGNGYAFIAGIGYAANLGGLLALGLLAGLVANRIGRLSSQ